jgi:hypothetical protein
MPQISAQTWNVWVLEALPHDAVIAPPLDVAPERALLGSPDRLWPDSDNRRKADRMKSSDPADYQDTPRPIPDGEGVTSPPAAGFLGTTAQLS